MADQLKVTVKGRVATDPVIVSGSGHRQYTRFRMAHTPRIFDPERRQWQDGQTEWFDVRIEREQLARNAGFSLHRGIPVVVLGRLRTAQWTGEDGKDRLGLTLDAETIAIDLAFGVAHYMKAVRVPDSEAPGTMPWSGAAATAGTGSDGERGTAGERNAGSPAGAADDDEAKPQNESEESVAV